MTETIGIVASIIAIAFFVIKAFIKQSEKNSVSRELSSSKSNEYLQEIGRIYKENSERNHQTTQEMIHVIERNNNLIENNNKVMERWEDAVKELKDITMKALLKTRGEQNID